MKKLIVLGIIFILLGCRKEINFKNIQDSINVGGAGTTLDYELLDYAVLDTINKREFYNIELKENNKFLDSVSKAGESERWKSLIEAIEGADKASIAVLKEKDFDSANADEFYYVIRYTYQNFFGTHNKTGYFDKNLKLESYYPR
jgi:hypothetical protein